jgi:hypothetical protein
MISISKTAPKFLDYPEFDLEVKVVAKTYKQEGDLDYIYQPFRNIQISKDYEANGLKYKKGQLVDFRTDQLNFSLENPIDMQIQPSYDGTVNLILNDDLNPPRIINSRFTVTEDKTFKIIDRKGENDTNIYEQDNVDLETRLFKNYNVVPYVEFNGLQEGGALKAGNYCFFFKYTDADNNESDIICETGVIPVHDGKVNDPFSITGGLEDTNCNKLIKLTINNIDTAYDYLNIYYTRSSGENSFTNYTKFVKILDRKIISSDTLEITITGFENEQEIDHNLLNVEYNMVDRVKTQAQIQNMLFFANVDKPTTPYADLEDLSLRILPSVSNSNTIGCLNHNYEPTDGNVEHIEYYNMKNVYNFTGYWNGEIYRFGVVYILKDDSLSPVFNVRGCDNLGETTKLKNPPLYITKYDDNGNPYQSTERNYIPISEDGFYQNPTTSLENIKGVVKLNFKGSIIETEDVPEVYPLAINFNIENEVLDEIRKFAKGFFFVRQKRIATILGQGLTIGVDSESYLPVLKRKDGFVAESFLDDNRVLTSDFSRHLLVSEEEGLIAFNGLYSPELTNNKIISNGLFNNSEFTLSNSFINNSLDYLNQDSRHFYIDSYKNQGFLNSVYKSKLMYVQDSAPLKVLDGKFFSALAGQAEEAFRIKYFEKADKTTGARRILRGQFGPYIGASAVLPETKILNIHTPGYDETLMLEYFKTRFYNMQTYRAISNRYDLNKLYLYNNIKEDQNIKSFVEYRGDCFINTVTVRVNRNFLDPETPINDEILQNTTWRDNYLYPTDQDDKKDSGKINRSDVNAVGLGHWVTFKVFSNINLCLRSLDDKHPEEEALQGQKRGYFPVQSMSYKCNAKMEESEIFNSGYKSTVPEKEYSILPDVPYIKNIFENRIMFSLRNVTDSFQNGYRIFQGLTYQDVTKQYGAIVKIFNWKDNILCVFENGVALFAVNERALIQTETGASIHMYGAGVLPEKELAISPDFGSRWPDSIIKTPIGIYGVDSEAKKIWRYSENGFEILSDFKIQKFLNENLIMDADEYKPIVGLRNVKTHYDNFKGDVMFTFYNCTRDEDKVWSLVYNERLGKWITRTSWVPLASENINNIFVSFDRDTAKDTSLNAYSLESCNVSSGIVLDNNIIIPEGGLIGTLKIKGYDYYEKYDKNYYLVDNQDLFYIEGDKLFARENNINSTIITVGVKLTNGLVNAPDFVDYILIKKDNNSLRSNYLYKHGQANLFYNDEVGIIKPSTWYEKIHPFEYEFILNDNFQVQKIFNNLRIISNKVKPEQFTISVLDDAYSFSNDFSKEISRIIDIKDISTVGRLRGNIQYKEGVWDLIIPPMDQGKRSARPRNKYARVKFKYNGDDLAVITSIQNFYTISHA